ncbi:LysR substrate-binding domain-containing protein [Rhodobacter capsulatus]|uniref:LysR substrate-binding domain-containing protein n=1 Tax=Rhodobacter capsulatus TaxID=1061 RepID=UPI004038D83C
MARPHSPRIWRGMIASSTPTGSSRGAGSSMRAACNRGAAQEVTVQGRFHVNSARAAAELAIAGLGIAHAPRFAVCGALDTGALVPVLSGFHSPPSPVSAVYLEGRVLPRKLRALIDFAAEDIRHAGIL